MSNPLVSTIIPTYNRECYILEALKSALTQTYRNHEIIIIDDGSTDNTKELLLPYQNNIRYVFQMNSGPSMARNSGILLAKGELIAFLDSDDIWTPDKIEKQVLCFKNDPMIGLCYTGKAFVDSEGKALNKAHNWNYPEGSAFERLLLNNYISSSSLVMCPKRVLIDVGLFDPEFRTSQDYELWLRVSYKYRLKYIAENLVLYRFHGGGISRTLEGRYLNNLRIIRKMDFLYGKNQRVRTLLKKKEFNLNLEYGECFFFDGNMALARRTLFKALKFAPWDIRLFYRMFLCCLGGKTVAMLRQMKARLKVFKCKAFRKNIE